MIKNFIVKKGDQLSFTITFTSNLPITVVEWGVKKNYSDEVYTILKSLGDGITKLSDTKYSFTLTSSDTANLDYYNYPYDIWVKVGDNVKTPLSGKIFIKETTRLKANG